MSNVYPSPPDGAPDSAPTVPSGDSDAGSVVVSPDAASVLDLSAMRSDTMSTVLAPGIAAAFAGAQGAGAQARGGRGGRVIEVTTLADSGAGSLRAAVEESGPRIVVFRVGGTITLNRAIFVRNPFLTIAGQTAPGGGILIRGSKSAQPNALPALFYVQTSNVVLRYLRLRLGVIPSFGALNGKDIVLEDGSQHFIMDHCSLSWAQDKLFSMWSFAASAVSKEVTLQRNIFSEPIYANSLDGTGVNIGGDSSEIAALITDADVHHNVFVSNRHRTPLFKGRTSRVISNIVFNWNSFATGWEEGSSLDIVSNLYKTGPDWGGAREIAYRPDGDRAAKGAPSIYITGNIGPSNLDGTKDNWEMIEVRPTWGRSDTAPPSAFRRASPMAPVGPAITPTPASELERMVLADVGASARLDAYGEWVSNRDAVDARVVADYLAGRGKQIADEKEVGGYPNLAAGTPYEDVDKDGMSDAWERRFGFVPTNAADGAEDADKDGYANLEEFLNGTPPK